LGNAQGAALGAGKAAANQSFSQPIASGTESFRTGWQSLLASLGSSVEGVSETGAETDQRTATAGQALADAAGKSSVSTSTPDAAAGLRVKQETEKGTGLASAGLKVSQNDARTDASAGLSTTTVKTTATSSANEKKTRADQESESTRGWRLTHSAKVGVTDVAAATSSPELIPLATASSSQSVPVAATGTIAQGADLETQSTLAETSTDWMIGSLSESASASSSSYSPNLDAIKAVAGAANATVQKAGEGPESLGKQGGAMSARNSNGSSGTAFDETDASTAGGGTGPQIAISTEGGNSLEAASTSQSLTQTPALGQSGIPAQPANQKANLLPAAMDRNGLYPSSAAANAAPSGQIPAVSRTESKLGLASDKKLSASDQQQSKHGTSNLDSAQHGNTMLQGQSSGADADASATARAGAGAGGTASATGDLTDRASSATTGPDSREAFSTLDADGATGKPTWIQAGAQHAEAGFQDPSLGWVGVRADTSGGSIHAQLVPGSSDAAQTLGSHMAGLSAYLAEHHTPVETLTLTSPESGSPGFSSGAGSGDGTQQGAGQETSQGTMQGAGSRGQFASSAAPESPDWFAGRDADAQATGLDGHQISVMA
jgi:hypothetical protein